MSIKRGLCQLNKNFQWIPGNSFLSHGHSHCHQDPSLMSPDAPSVVIISNNRYFLNEKKNKG